MNWRYFLILIFVIAASCNQKQEKRTYQGEIISHKQMVNLLVDCYIAESALINISQESNKVKADTRYYYDFVFKKHKVTRQQVFESINYYSFRSKEISEIYNDLLNKLALLNTKPTPVPKSEE